MEAHIVGRKASVKKYLSGTFLPSSPVVKNPHFHFGGRRFDPQFGNYNPPCRSALQKKKKEAQFINKKIVSPVQQLMI